ncbi:MAG: zinc-binding alcohol dehydrogenase family protein [Rhodospirillaceae bacterium]|nr:MAG: zinc-binding alcohol dehydrogenase family protein [Rhodospirillaceae bacterium]
MRVMRLNRPGEALLPAELPTPRPEPGEVLVRVDACAVCRTDLHVVDGDLASPKLPLIPGHEIVGRIVARGSGAMLLETGTRVGVPWLGWTCGTCAYCTSDRENLCPQAQFTGYTRDGGFAEYCVADARYCFPLPDMFGDVAAAPLMCAGLIGYRAYRKIGDAKRLGLYGFGAAAHILTQVAVHDGRSVYAFTKPGDVSAQGFARSLGCTWAAGSDASPPEPLDAAIIFAPVGALVPTALKALRPGGVLICAGIHMSDIPAFPYHLLWSERLIQSVANLTRADGEAFLRVAPQVPVRTSTRRYGLADVNAALDDLRHGRFDGAAVIVMDQG